MAVRTFLALDLDETTRAALARAARGIDAGNAKINWVRPEYLHVTLKFLGNVEDRGLNDVCLAVAEAAGQAQPLEFDVRGVIPVPPGRRLRMLWGGVEDPTGVMTQLHTALEETLAPLGFEPEARKFKPHITLARIRSARDPGAITAAAAQLAQEHFGTVRGEEVVVYSSELTPHGPVYIPMSHAPLG